jgi:hypothetical protein
LRYAGSNVRVALENAVNEDQRMGRWWVADRYDVRRTDEGSRCIVSPYDWPTASASSRWETYRPLISHPHLFLEFARLADRIDGPPPPEVDLESDRPKMNLNGFPETDNNTEIALSWAEKYGVLGLEGGRDDPDPLGGEEDTVRAFCEEADWAYDTLTLYEAATDPHEVDVYLIVTHADAPHEIDHILSDREYARRYALKEVMRYVELHVGKYCFPALFRDGDSVVQGWSFDSLLGAMWLQMMWLVTSKDVPRRCAGPGCNRIVSYAQPQQPQEWRDQSIDPWKKNDRSRGYRTRKDKKFCSHNCRVKNWQHKQKRKNRA